MALTACTEKEKDGANADGRQSIAESDSQSEVNTGVDGARIIAADLEPGNWLSHGRSYDEQRFSPLEYINTTNVDQLGLAWSFDYGIGTEVKATPIVVNGVIYTTGQLNTVYALDAKSGSEYGAGIHNLTVSGFAIVVAVSVAAVWRFGRIRFTWDCWMAALRRWML